MCLHTEPERGPACRLVGDAKSWLAKVRSMSQTKAPLKKMRELLHAGLRLGTEMPQVDQLRTDIRTREWEDSARKACLHLSVRRGWIFLNCNTVKSPYWWGLTGGLPQEPVLL